MKKSLKTLAVVAALGMAVTGLTASPADAATKHHTGYAGKHYPHYKNCTSLNKDFKHGVGLPKAKDKHGKTTKAVTNFKKSTTLYRANDGAPKKGRSKWEKDLDRDNDGIACEKR